MPLYEYCCKAHGTQEIIQGMNDVHEAMCPACSKPMRRIFTTSHFREKPQMGKTRLELFNNLASEGMAPKNWREHDPYLNH
jgi:putative FmdB family regulatory protein